MQQKFTVILGTIFLLLFLPFFAIGLALNNISKAITYTFDLWDESNTGKAIVLAAIIITSVMFIQLINSIYTFSVDMHYLLLKNNIVINSKIIRYVFVIIIFFTAFFSMKKAREAVNNSNHLET